MRADIAGGEIERVLWGNVLQSTGHAHDHGEWDWLPLVDKRTMRRLTGAGYFARNGIALDEAIDMIVERVGGVETRDQALDWYISTALRELDERQGRRAGVVAWEDLERPDDEWDPDDPDLADPVPVSVPDVVLPELVELAEPDVAECPSVDWLEEPEPRYPAGSRPTFYGSERPRVRVSAWDSVPDDLLARRRCAQHRTWWWRVRAWFPWT